MLLSCWSAKGGAGTTVVSAALAITLARRAASNGGDPVLLVDLAGDLPAVLGMAEPSGPGVRQWLGAGDDVPVDGLGRIEVVVTDHLSLLPRGVVEPGAPDRTGSRGGVLADLLAADGRVVVADCGLVGAGVGGDGAAMALAQAADHSILVTRLCYLALRRFRAGALRPSEVVVVTEPGRSLGAADVEAVVGAEVVAEVPHDVAVARAVDAGLLVRRLPRSLDRAIRWSS